MDHRISKDMISSGMIPSGEKKQEDLSRTQYGTAPSPNALSDVYKKMYETKEEVINEMVGKGMGITPAPKPSGGGITPAKRVEKSNLPAKRVEKSNLPKPQDPATSKPQKDFIKARMSDSPSPKTEPPKTDSRMDQVKKLGFAKSYRQIGPKSETEDMLDRVTDRKIDRKVDKDMKRDRLKKIMADNESVDLLAVYRSVYEHHKKDADGNTIPHEGEEIEEGAGLYANIHAKRKRGGKMRKKGAKGAPSSQDFANASKTAKEEVDKFDVVFNHFISEGYSEKEAYAEMANLTEEQLDEFLKALAQAGMRGAESVGKATRGVSTSLAKQGAMTDPKFRRLGKVQGPAPNTPSQTLTDLRQRRQQQSDNLRSRIDTAASQLKSGSSKFGSTSQQKPQQKEKPKPTVDKRPPVQGPVTSITAPPIKRNRSKQIMQDEYQYVDEYAQLLTKGAAMLTKALKPVANAAKTVKKTVSNVVKDPTVQNIATQTAVGAVMNSGGGGQKERSKQVSTAQYQSADLFDIVKGQLLDEGLSEEEIKDIMLSLTPDEILKEIEESSMSAGSSGGHYSDGGDGVFRSKEQVGRQFNKNFPPAKNGKVDKPTRKAINTSARDFGIQGPTTLKQSVEPEGETI